MKFSKLRVSPKRNEEKIRENAAARRPASPNAKAYELQKCLSDDGTLVLSDQDILSQNETMMFIDAEGGNFGNLKFSFSEKATKIWRNLPQGFDFT